MRIFICLLFICCHSHLITKGIHIVNESTGERVRLKCVNWYGAHQEPLVPGGLEVTSSDSIADLIVQMGANCVRIPLADQAVLADPVVDPRFIMGRTATVMQVLDAVVESLSSRGLMTILNSHTSKPGWVGSWEEVPQGLWHGHNISTAEWVRGLALLAARYRSNPLVVGMDLRNEIHDQDKTVITWGRSADANSDWLAASTLAEQAIAAVNPHVLIIVSGLCRAYDLRPLMDQPGPSAAFHRSKLVYTTHVYTFSWWWARFNWHSVMYCAIAGVVLSSMCIYWPFYSFSAFAGSFTPFAALWIAVACVRASIARDIGCDTLATESTPWIVAGCLLMLLSFICLMVFVLSDVKQVIIPLLECLLCWICLACVATVVMSCMTGTYWMVVDDLRRWRLERRVVPVFVGEFGTGVGDSTWQWGYLMQVIREFDLDFAYWAVNGRKWNRGAWEPEDFGLLTYNYSALSDTSFTSTIFA